MTLKRGGIPLDQVEFHRLMEPIMAHAISVANERQHAALDLAFKVQDFDLVLAILFTLYDKTIALGPPPAPPTAGAHDPHDEWTAWSLKHGSQWDAWQQYPPDEDDL